MLAVNESTPLPFLLGFLFLFLGPRCPLCGSLLILPKKAKNLPIMIFPFRAFVFPIFDKGQCFLLMRYGLRYKRVIFVRQVAGSPDFFRLRTGQKQDSGFLAQLRGYANKLATGLAPNTMMFGIKPDAW